MKNKKYTFQYILIIFLLLGNYSVFSQTIHKHLRYGDEHYYKESFSESEESYRKALQKDTNSVNANYNLGNVLYKQERFDEAANYYAEALENTENEEQKAKAYHNLGNANLSQLPSINDPQQQQKMLNDGIEAYKNALKINPDDNSTKYNLAYAQRLLSQMQQNPPPQPQQGESQNEEEQNQSQEPQNNENKENKKQQPPKQKEENKKQEEQPKPGEMSKKEAERLLKIMEEEERKVQSKINKEKGKANPSSKDW